MFGFCVHNAEAYKRVQNIRTENTNSGKLIDKIPISNEHFPSWMTFVQGGSFMMGSNHDTNEERPAHKVSVNSFYISKYEVTQSLWKTIMEVNPSATIGRNNPVENVTWYDCVRFCNALNRYMGCHECYVFDGDSVYYKNGVKNCFRLPTEEEWEFAAKGGVYSRGYKYAGSNNINTVAWQNKNSKFHLHPVGTKLPNELGLYDMSGNVEEACWDEYGAYPNVNNDSLGRSACLSKVYRGGSWCSENDDYYCKVVARSGHNTDSYSMETGMRLVFIGDTSKINAYHEILNKSTLSIVDTVSKMPLTKTTLPYWMVKVDGGKYTLGAINHEASVDEKTKHTALLPTYFISKYEITQGIWCQIMGRPSNFRDNNYPMDSISFYDCVRFCNALSKYYGYNPCYKIVKHKVILLNGGKGAFRIPTEDEWECAARGGSKSRGYIYSGSNNMRKVAWCVDNSGRIPHDVGLKLPNELGLYDMSGNEWEICWTPDNQYSVPIRGSSVNCQPFDFSVEAFDSCDVNERFSGLGFRIVFEP